MKLTDSGVRIDPLSLQGLMDVAAVGLLTRTLSWQWLKSKPRY